jgi:hypothetical protein
MRVTRLIFLVLILAASRLVYAQSDKENASEKQDTRWGFAAALFNQGSGEIAVSKKLSKTTMILLSAEIRWSNSDTDEKRKDTRNENSSRSLSIIAGPELRKYYYRTSGLALYPGIQPMVGHVWLNTENTTTQFDNLKITGEQKRRITSIGLNLSFGVEYEFLDNLSLSAHFRPLSYLFSKQTTDDQPDQPGALPSRTSLKEHHLMFSQTGALFVRIYF